MDTETDPQSAPNGPSDGDGSTASRQVGRVRPKPGERRLQILQTLATMLQEPGGERVTTAALAGRLEVSEAALYRHFASKAQMFEGLIQFIEQSLFGLINQIVAQETDPLKQLRAILLMLLSFAERNPGMTRVLIGDALVTEDARLQGRINQLTDRIEASVKQCFRNAVEQGRLPPENDAAARANLVISFVLGRWVRYAKTGFKRAPADKLEQQVLLLIT
jgi:TetR/AcrR family transcriptional regulator